MKFALTANEAASNALKTRHMAERRRTPVMQSRVGPDADWNTTEAGVVWRPLLSVLEPSKPSSSSDHVSERLFKTSSAALIDLEDLFGNKT